jgi:hypothetical protein
MDVPKSYVSNMFIAENKRLFVIEEVIFVMSSFITLKQALIFMTAHVHYSLHKSNALLQNIHDARNITIKILLFYETVIGFG